VANVPPQRRPAIYILTTPARQELAAAQPVEAVVGNLRQLDAALQHYRKAVTLNPRHHSAHEHLGEAYLMLGDRTKCRQNLVKQSRCSRSILSIFRLHRIAT
jgi:Flp pilus assembly protein TadD